MTPTDLNQINTDSPRFVLSGTTTRNGSGIGTNFSVLHNTGLENFQVFITPLNSDTMIPYYVSAKTPDLFSIEFATPPPVGTGNVQFDWLLVKVMSAIIQ